MSERRVPLSIVIRASAKELTERDSRLCAYRNVGWITETASKGLNETLKISLLSSERRRGKLGSRRDRLSHLSKLWRANAFPRDGSPQNCKHSRASHAGSR